LRRSIVPIVTGIGLAGTLCALGLVVPCAADPRARPMWNVSGHWDGFNGAEYVIFRQRSHGLLDVTVHHTCAPGHVERGSGRISGSHIRARVEPAVKPQPPACVAFATIDVRVDPDGRRLRGRYTTDRDAGALLYIGRRQARSLIRFRPRIERASGGVRVRLRPTRRLPRGAVARVRVCHARRCVVRHGRSAPRVPLPGRGCSVLAARVTFARSAATTHRRICLR
jgi:hypothetical protein